MPMIVPSCFHSPVLLPEVIDGLKIEAGKKYIDATIGGGGYATEILKRGGIMLGIDVDQEAINYVKRKYQISNIKYQIGKDVFLERGNFADLKSIADKFGFSEVAGILFDLGMSTYQIKRSGRGFSFEIDEPLDMRMGTDQNLTATDIINKYSREELHEIFTKFAEELYFRTITSAIIRTRSLKGPILTTGKLVEIINQVVKDKKNLRKTLARIFQALRISVNNELTNLEKGILQAIELLEPKGRLLVLSYHSLEDRIVKLKFKETEKKGILQIITKGPIKPNLAELKINPASRSAKLRIAEKI